MQMLLNRCADYGKPLHDDDAGALGRDAARAVTQFLAQRADHHPTPLVRLGAFAASLGVAAIDIKDESHRLGLGSFKALGGAYAVLRLVIEAAEAALERKVDLPDLDTADVRGIAAALTFGCATDGNHGRSVAAGARLAGARSVIFVHERVSDERVAAIASFGAEIIRVPGTYDDSVAEAARVCAARGWTVVSDTAWPGYERIPGLVMQGYTAIITEALAALPAPPTHVFVQAGVGGVAAAVAGHLALTFGSERPTFIVVEPARAACVYASARDDMAVKIAHGEPTVMAMLECYEPSFTAWRVLSRAADAFITVEEEDAIAAMRQLAFPLGSDLAIVAGESGCVGLAGLIRAAQDAETRAGLRLDDASRVLLINTEGATDTRSYTALVGRTPEEVLKD
jgi:diaminopropionate ammonia-lyase